MTLLYHTNESKIVEKADKIRIADKSLDFTSMVKKTVSYFSTGTSVKITTITIAVFM